MTTLIDGNQQASHLHSALAVQVRELKKQHNLIPGLVVLLVGDDAASEVYVRNKEQRAKECGFYSRIERLPASTSQVELLERIDRLNHAPDVNGILVQLPLPGHIDEQSVIQGINPAKDVDGFHPINVGRLASGGEGLVPCTPLGCLILLKQQLTQLAGLNAVIVGRSNIVGKPLAQLLLREHCTVTLAHSHTRDLARECSRADILIAAVGRPGLIQGDWLKPGAVVLDVGITRVVEGDRSRLVGDVDFAQAWPVVKAITPVPGGVGPMTIACLLLNTWEATCSQHGLPLASNCTGELQ